MTDESKPKLKRNPTYSVYKPTAAELRAMRPYLVDRIIRWAQGDDTREGYCSVVEEALTYVFGRPPANGWRDSRGFDCYGYDVNNRDEYGRDPDGYDMDDYDEMGLHRITRRTADGYDRWDKDKDGYNRDGYNDRGEHRDGIDHVLRMLTGDQREKLRIQLNAEKDASQPSLACDHDSQDS